MGPISGSQAGLSLKAEDSADSRRHDRQRSKFLEALEGVAGGGRRERQCQPFLKYHKAPPAVRRMKQGVVHRLRCTNRAPTTTTTPGVHSQVAQSIFIGVACFVSGSGWFVNTHMRGPREHGKWIHMKWGMVVGRQATAQQVKWVR